MNDFLKPIETNYKGYKFRSRLEARWGVFFDALNLKWQYEVEGFKLSNGEYYLPDFKVLSIDNMVYWYEVKPYGESGDGKLQQFAKDYWNKSLSNDFNILSGDPFEVMESGFIVCPRCAGINNIRIYEDNTGAYFTCYNCDRHTPGGSGNSSEKGIIVQTMPHKGELWVSNEDYEIYKTVIKNACTKARSARF
jgi:hypothetical protein